MKLFILFLSLLTSQFAYMANHKIVIDSKQAADSKLKNDVKPKKPKESLHQKKFGIKNGSQDHFDQQLAIIISSIHSIKNPQNNEQVVKIEAHLKNLRELLKSNIELKTIGKFLDLSKEYLAELQDEKSQKEEKANKAIIWSKVITLLSDYYRTKFQQQFPMPINPNLDDNFYAVAGPYMM